MKFQKTNIGQAAKLLADNNRIALFAHTNPDGDTVGACVALCLALRKSGHVCEVFCDSDLGSSIAKFEETSIIRKQFVGEYDLFVAVDCGDIFRTGEFAKLYDGFERTLTIDHHCGQFYSRFNCLYDYASTCQMVYEILHQMGLTPDSTVATYLYMGLCTDTGNFMNRNTDKASFVMAGELLDLGADITKVCRTFFREKTLVKTRLIGRALNKLRVYDDGQVVLLYITQNDLADIGAELTDTSVLVNFAVDVDTARVGIAITECNKDEFKVSMRGKDVCVRLVCEEFGGGGHDLAAGCKLQGPLEEVIEKLIRTVGFYL